MPGAPQDPLFDGDDEANTPITAEEREDLIPTWVTVRAELNRAEQMNIADADGWAFRRRRDVLGSRFLRQLHKRMLGDVWRWAGQFRRTARNIGVDAYRIATDLEQLLDDVRYWIDQRTYDPDEIAIRFHHRLVAIHPFPNGNGRHARLAADLLANYLDRPRFSWGSGGDLGHAHDVRRAYVDALRAADRHDIGPLMAFARA